MSSRARVRARQTTTAAREERKQLWARSYPLLPRAQLCFPFKAAPRNAKPLNLPCLSYQILPPTLGFLTAASHSILDALASLSQDGKTGNLMIIYSLQVVVSCIMYCASNVQLQCPLHPDFSTSMGCFIMRHCNPLMFSFLPHCQQIFPRMNI